ncbi:MAG: hypothetical protein FWB78_03255 [Treponema sp.]|nr:hypothetical protein [Treponema sp.]
MEKCSRLFLLALMVMAIGFSTIACSEPLYCSSDTEVSVAGTETLAVNTYDITITIKDIPGQYDWGGISLWNNHGEELGSHIGMATDNSFTVTLPGEPGLYDAILSLWDVNTDRHWRIWSMDLNPGANIIPFNGFIEFTD